MGLFSPSKITTQQHLPIEDIRDDLVIMKNGKCLTGDGDYSVKL